MSPLFACRFFLVYRENLLLTEYNLSVTDASRTPCTYICKARGRHVLAAVTLWGRDYGILYHSEIKATQQRGIPLSSNIESFNSFFCLLYIANGNVENLTNKIEYISFTFGWNLSYLDERIRYPNYSQRGFILEAWQWKVWCRILDQCVICCQIVQYIYYLSKATSFTVRQTERHSQGLLHSK